MCPWPPACRGLGRNGTLLVPGTSTYKVIWPLLLFVSWALWNGMWERECTSLELSFTAPPCPQIPHTPLPSPWASCSHLLGLEQLLQSSRVHLLSNPFVKKKKSVLSVLRIKSHWGRGIVHLTLICLCLRTLLAPWSSNPYCVAFKDFLESAGGWCSRKSWTESDRPKFSSRLHSQLVGA